MRHYAQVRGPALEALFGEFRKEARQEADRDLEHLLQWRSRAGNGRPGFTPGIRNFNDYGGRWIPDHATRAKHAGLPVVTSLATANKAIDRFRHKRSR